MTGRGLGTDDQETPFLFCLLSQVALGNACHPRLSSLQTPCPQICTQSIQSLPEPLLSIPPTFDPLQHATLTFEPSTLSSTLGSVRPGSGSLAAGPPYTPAPPRPGVGPLGSGTNQGPPRWAVAADKARDDCERLKYTFHSEILKGPLCIK